jgi:hypothetical protein
LGRVKPCTLESGKMRDFVPVRKFVREEDSFRAVVERKWARSFCHPDGASNASGWKDLGKQRASAAGSGFVLLPSKEKRSIAISET